MNTRSREARINEKIHDIHFNEKWNVKIAPGSSHDEFVMCFCEYVFLDLMMEICGQNNTDECNVVLKRALAKCWTDTSKPIMMMEIVIAFLEELKIYT